jgi:hypothetical protein
MVINQCLVFLGGIGTMELLLLILFIVVPTLLFIYAIIDLIKRPFADNTTKIIWALVIIFLPFIGSIVYLVVERKRSYRKDK